MKKEKNAHPSYPNPTLVETLCELHFDSSVAPEDHLQWCGSFFNKVQSDFPKMVPQQILEMGAKIGNSGEIQEIKVPRLRMMLRHKVRPHLLLLSQGIMGVNELQPYPGWKRFLNDIHFAWKTLGGVLEIRGLRRIGLRYINRIPKDHRDDPVRLWLKESPLFPASALDQTGAFSSRFDHRPAPDVRQIVTLGSNPVKEDEKPYLIFDIDTILEKELPGEWPIVLKHLESMHDRIWEAFSHVCTAGYLHLLKRNKKS
jgi:uncharacterized protein (TIGR04255 family)